MFSLNGASAHASRPRRRRTALLGLLGVALALGSAPALAIFANGGFEQNSFAGWTLGGGTNPGLIGSEPFTAASIQINPGAAGPAAIVGQVTDPLAPTILLPRVGQLTAKLNDENGGALVTTLVQVDTVSNADIDPADGLPHIRFAFAPVMDDPNHAPDEQPYFYVSVKNLADNSIVFEQFAYSGQAGVNFLSGAGNWKYLEFQNVDVTLPSSAVGGQVELTVIAADCALGGHGGYVYVDGFGSSNVPPPSGGAVEVTEVPVNRPAMLMLLAGLLSLGVWRRRRMRG
jgi:MYXO-CTERM domain-containing protein